MGQTAIAGKLTRLMRGGSPSSKYPIGYNGKLSHTHVIAMFQSYEYFYYEVTPIPGKLGYFLVSPAWGYPTQWGESHGDQWEQSTTDLLNFLDVTEAQLLAL